MARYLELKQPRSRVMGCRAGLVAMFEYQGEASLEAVREMRAFLAGKMRVLGAGEHRDRFVSAISELAINAVRHPRPPATQFRLRIRTTGLRIEVELMSDADGFADRQTLLQHVRPHAQGPSAAESGRGLYIATRLFPALDYVSRAGAGDGFEHYRLSTEPRSRRAA